MLQDGLDIWYELCTWFDKYLRLYYDDNVDGKRVGSYITCLPHNSHTSSYNYIILSARRGMSLTTSHRLRHQTLSQGLAVIKLLTTNTELLISILLMFKNTKLLISLVK